MNAAAQRQREPVARPGTAEPTAASSGGNGTAGAPEAELVARVLEGDRDSYAVLVRRHQDTLFRHALGMRLDHDTAADLVQDAFVTAYVRLRECRDPSRFRYWVLRILRNRCLDYLKDVRRNTVPIDGVEGDEPTGGQHDATAELRVTIDRALANLPESLRDAFLMKHHAGYSYDEMAEIAGGSVSAMKMRVHRAREMLRASLLDEAAEPK